MLIGIVSVKGSPGATTVGLAVAALWPAGAGVLVEADPAGGDLSARFGLNDGPGLASMAVAARRGDKPPDPACWTRRLPVGAYVVPAPAGVAAAAAVRAMAGHGRRQLSALAGVFPVLVVDVGRWSPGSGAEEALSACQVLLLVARPRVDEIHHCLVRVEALRRLVPDVRLVVADSGDGWPAGEVGAVLGLPVAGVVPRDRPGAGVLAGRLVPQGRARGLSSWRRLPLPRACDSLARALAAPTPAVPAPAGLAAVGPARAGVSDSPPVWRTTEGAGT